jgi:DNA mismatch endonuclease, patch repair protein
MADRLSKEHRSWNMSRIGGKDTKPEKTVRSVLHRMGYRFRLHCRDLPGCPDIVMPKYRLVIFVHGCFWHRHADCVFAYMPRSRQDFWRSKFDGTVLRDRRTCQKLELLNWKVTVIWECETKNQEFLKEKILSLIKL